MNLLKILSCGIFVLVAITGTILGQPSFQRLDIPIKTKKISYERLMYPLGLHSTSIVLDMLVHEDRIFTLTKRAGCYSIPINKREETFLAIPEKRITNEPYRLHKLGNDLFVDNEPGILFNLTPSEDALYEQLRYASSYPVQHTIIDILTTSDSTVYIATQHAGLFVYNLGKNGGFYRYQREDGLLPSNHILTLHEDSFGRIWIGTMKGLCAIINNELINYSSHYFEKERMRFNRNLDYPINEAITAIESIEDKILIGGEFGLQELRISRDQKIIETRFFKFDRWFRSNDLLNIDDIMIDYNDRVWVAGNLLFHFQYPTDQVTDLVVVQDLFPEFKSSNAHVLLQLPLDEEVWVGTLGSGIYIFKNPKIDFNWQPELVTTPFLPENHTISGLSNWIFGLSAGKLTTPFILHDIKFESNHFDLTEEAEAYLNTVAQHINTLGRQKSIDKIIIHGHSSIDLLNNEKGNNELAFNRAKSIKLYLQSHCPDYNITVFGHGDSKPLATYKNDPTHPAHRRVELEIILK